MTKFSMTITKPSEDMVLAAVEEILDVSPTLVNQYSVLATLLRKGYNIEITRDEVKTILDDEEDEITSVEAIIHKDDDDVLRDMYEDSVADALVNHGESPFIDEHLGHHQEIDYYSNKLGEQSDDIWNELSKNLDDMTHPFDRLRSWDSINDAQAADTL